MTMEHYIDMNIVIKQIDVIKIVQMYIIKITLQPHQDIFVMRFQMIA